MELSFSTRKMRKACSSEKEMVKAWGTANAKKLQQRLMELKAADSLSDISHLPPARCHELGENRAGQISVDLKHPLRLIFIPDHDPVFLKQDGGLDWSQVTKVLIIEVTDTHK